MEKECLINVIHPPDKSCGVLTDDDKVNINDIYCEHYIKDPYWNPKWDKLTDEKWIEIEKKLETMFKGEKNGKNTNISIAKKDAN